MKRTDFLKRLGLALVTPALLPIVLKDERGNVCKGNLVAVYEKGADMEYEINWYSEVDGKKHYIRTEYLHKNVDL